MSVCFTARALESPHPTKEESPMFRTVVVAATVIFAATLARPVSARTVDPCGGGCPTPPKNARAVAVDVPLSAYPITTR